MRPILFDKSATNFSTNGIGRLECISCHVVEERNGMFELEAVVPIIGEHTADVKMESIIGAIPHDGGTIQAFRVYKIGKPINGKFTVYARHISYLLSDIPTMPFSVSLSPSACANTLAGLKNNAIESCPFNFYTDVTTASSYKQSAPASIRERLGGVEGSVLDQFGGEYEWDNFDVHLWKQRGRLANVTGITLRYGKNITDINQEEAISNTVTGIVPYWIDTEGNNLVTLPEKVVYSQNASNFAYHLTQVLDLSSNFQEKPTVSQLRTYANTYVNKSGFGVPNVSIKVSFVNLWETEEYKDIAPLERVQLCDEINVQFEKLGISTVAKVVKTDYDVLKGRYRSIEVGHIRSNLTQAVTDRDKEIDTAFLDQITRIGQQISDATAWLTSANGYVVAVKNTDGSWKELLFMDTNDPSTARNVLRINNNGIGFSTNGINGPYSTAWTIDGRLGDAANKNYWNFLTGEFRLSATAGINVNANEANYTGAYVPTNSNIPAVNWTADQKKQHVGETFYNTSNQKTYIYKGIATFETEHPYPAGVTNNYYHVSVPKDSYGAFLQFDSQSETETNWDYIDIYKRNYQGNYYKARFTGSIGQKYFTIDGYTYGTTNDVWIVWTTDGTVTKWGWKLDVVDTPQGTDASSSFSADTLPSYSWTDITWGDFVSFEWVEATLEEYIDVKASQQEQQDLTQEEVYNILTNNGQTQGLFLQNGKIYLNGQYFTANAITIGGSNYSQKPYLQVLNSSNDETVKLDINGMKAIAGQFGNMFINTTKRTISGVEKTYSYLTYGGNASYIKQEWEQYSSTVINASNNSGSFIFVPYAEGWTVNDTLDCQFELSFESYPPTTAKEKATQCTIKITQYNENGKMSNASSGGVQYQGSKTFWLNYEGWQKTSDSGSVTDVYGMEGYQINKDWGKNAGEFYQIEWEVAIRNNSYASDITLEISDNGNGYSFYLGSDLGSDNPEDVRCLGKFQGYFTGNASLTALDLGKWIYTPYESAWKAYSIKSNSAQSRFALLTPGGLTFTNDQGTIDGSSSSSAKWVGIRYNTIQKASGSSGYQVVWESTSDERVKKNIQPLPTELSKQLIDGTQPKSFEFIDPDEKGKRYGMVAQEARKLLDSLGETDAHLEYITDAPSSFVNLRCIHYEEYIPHLINYVKDLRAEIESLKEEIAKLKNT